MFGCWPRCICTCIVHSIHRGRTWVPFQRERLPLFYAYFCPVQSYLDTTPGYPTDQREKEKKVMAPSTIVNPRRLYLTTSFLPSLRRLDIIPFDCCGYVSNGQSFCVFMHFSKQSSHRYTGTPCLTTGERSGCMRDAADGREHEATNKVSHLSGLVSTPYGLDNKLGSYTMFQRAGIYL